MDTLTIEPGQKARLDEVARLMLQIYQTLARMQYLDPDWIVAGPHDVSGIISAFRGEIDDSILYLYSILPYVDTGGTMDVDFYDGGEFARFDNGLDVETGRNPFYAEDEDEMMKPWMTPLSMIGNHETSIIYSARTHSIWIFSQMGVGSVDPGWGPNPRKRARRSNDNEESVDEESVDEESVDEESVDEESVDEESVDEESVAEESDDEESVDEESDDEESDDDEMEEGDFYIDGNCRPAGDVLRDINDWYEQLEELPGGGQHSPDDWDQDLTRPLYIKHGWLTGSFDGHAFQVDRIRSYASGQAQGSTSKPLEALERLQRFGGEGEMLKRKQQLESATTMEAKWEARWNLLMQQQFLKRHKVELQQARETLDRLCPGGTTEQRRQDMPLWEAEWLRVAVVKRQDTLRRLQETSSEVEAPDASLQRAHGLQLKHARHKVDIYQAAYEASRADAERLCPGKTFTSGTGWAPLDTKEGPSTKLERLETNQKHMLDDLTQSQNFLPQVPEAARNLRDGISMLIESLEYRTQHQYTQLKGVYEKEMREEATGTR